MSNEKNTCGLSDVDGSRCPAAACTAMGIRDSSRPPRRGTVPAPPAFGGAPAAAPDALAGFCGDEPREARCGVWGLLPPTLLPSRAEPLLKRLLLSRLLSYPAPSPSASLQRKGVTTTVCI